MGCRHERLECTNNVLRCMVCGAVLPLEVLRGTPSSVSREAAATFPQGKAFGDNAAAAGEGFEDESRESAEPAKAARKKKGRAAAAIPNP